MSNHRWVMHRLLLCKMHRLYFNLCRKCSNSLQAVCEEFGFCIRLSSYYEFIHHQYCSDMLFTNCVVWHLFVDSWQVLQLLHLCWIDYCNSLLFGSTHDVTSHLQRTQNYAARVILCLPKSSSITIHLKSLHLLPVKVRSAYKIACLCYHCHRNAAPSYVTDMLHGKPSHSRNTRSSLYTMPLLNRPAHSKATLGDRSFSFASSSVWNSIPNDVRCAPSLSSFNSRLKTFLFCPVYTGWIVSLITVHMCMAWPSNSYADGLS